MGTRPGDRDADPDAFLLRRIDDNNALNGMEKMLNHDAGIVAPTKLLKDMKAILRSVATDGKKAAIPTLNAYRRWHDIAALLTVQECLAKSYRR
jgi:acetate kinase